MVNPVPVQDAERIDIADDVKLIRGVEARGIIYGFSQDKDTLYGTDRETPFQDRLVRQAVAHAINGPAILQTTMRGAAEPAAQLVSPVMNGSSEDLSERPAHDPQRARELLAEAGYPDGFEFLLKCCNDRYINDESVCQATVAMLAQVGLDATLDAIPVRNHWGELRADNYDMYLLGWSPFRCSVSWGIRSTTCWGRNGPRPMSNDCANSWASTSRSWCNTGVFSNRPHRAISG